MLKKLAVSALISLAFASTAHAFNLGGSLSVGQDLVKAASLSDDEVKSMAGEASVLYDKKNKVAPASSPYTKRLAKLMKGMQMPEGVKPDVKVYLTDDVNAFAMANGTVRIYSGLMDKMTDDEVRYVIGHELGHVTLGHTKKAMQTAYAASAVRKAGSATGNNSLAQLSESSLGDLLEKLVNAQFSQAQENEADDFSMGFMKKNKYDPKAAVSALRKLEKMYGNSRSAFASHPAPGDRADRMEKAI